MLKEIICVSCPASCPLSVEMDDNRVVAVKGQKCKRGIKYAEKECTSPTRIVTTTVILEGASIDVLPVKTEKDIPKDKIFEVIKKLKGVKVSAPIELGQVIIENVAETGVNIVATRSV